MRDTNILYLILTTDSAVVSSISPEMLIGAYECCS